MKDMDSNMARPRASTLTLLDLAYLLFAALAVVTRLRCALALVVGDLLATHRVRGGGDGDKAPKSGESKLEKNDQAGKQKWANGGMVRQRDGSKKESME